MFSKRNKRNEEEKYKTKNEKTIIDNLMIIKDV